MARIAYDNAGTPRAGNLRAKPVRTFDVFCQCLHGLFHGHKAEDDLDSYDRQRRLVTREAIEKQSIRNKLNLESDGIAFGQELRHIITDKDRTYQYLLRVWMIASLRSAAELG